MEFDRQNTIVVALAAVVLTGALMWFFYSANNVNAAKDLEVKKAKIEACSTFEVKSDRLACIALATS